MPNSIHDSAVSRHRLLPETSPEPVKAHLRKTESESWGLAIGDCVRVVQQESGLSLKEFADRLQKDERQVSRWMDGKEHPQIAVIFAVPQFRQLLVLALAKLAGDGVRIDTVITLRRIG